jgi:putative ABC transport system substrate-binding protein
MRRREFMTAASLSLFSAHAARSQAERTPRLCFLTFDAGTAESPAPRFKAFFDRLRELGYVHGKTLTIEYVSAAGRADQYSSLAARCVSGHPDVIAVTTTPGARALKAATSAIPIVMVALGDPVGTHIVASLSQPGGNITGMSQMTSELAAKRLQLLKEMLPGVAKVLVLAYLVDPISPLQVEALKRAAPALGLDLVLRDIRAPEDLAAAFETGAKEGAQGLITTAESIFRAERVRVIALAAAHRLPAIYPYATFVVDAGGLMAYEVEDSDLHGRAASYVERILKGAKPADLPIQQPTKLRLAINLKTARSLGITVPASLLARADELIE